MDFQKKADTVWLQAYDENGYIREETVPTLIAAALQQAYREGWKDKEYQVIKAFSIPSKSEEVGK